MNFAPTKKADLPAFDGIRTERGKEKAPGYPLSRGLGEGTREVATYGRGLRACEQDF